MYPEEHLQQLAKQHNLTLKEHTLPNNLKEINVSKSESDQYLFTASFDKRGQLWGLDIENFNLDRFNNSEFSNEDINAALTALVEGKTPIKPRGLFRRLTLEIPLVKTRYYAKAK